MVGDLRRSDFVPFTLRVAPCSGLYRLHEQSGDGASRHSTAGTRALATAAFDLQRVVIPHVGGVLIILFGLHFLRVISLFLRWLECQPVLERSGKLGVQLKRGLVGLLGLTTGRPFDAGVRYGFKNDALMALSGRQNEGEWFVSAPA